MRPRPARAALYALLDSGITPQTTPVEARHIRVTNIVALLGAVSIGAWVPMAAAAGHMLSVVENSAAAVGFASGL